MRATAIVLFSLVMGFASCNSNAKRDKSLVPGSVGNINALQVVMPNDLWNGAVGESVREHFAAPADGLPQDEPLYSISQLNPDSFVDFARTNRIFLYVNIAAEERVGIVDNEYAKPQTGAVIEAPSEDRLIALIEETSDKIIRSFYQSEIKERQRRTAISTKRIDSLKRTMGVSFKMPSAYRIAAQGSQFFWFRKDLKDGTTNIMVYEAPLESIKSDSTALSDLIAIRDSIGSRLLPVEDDDLFITEAAYSPFLFKTKIDGKDAYEMRGTWEVTNAYMAGPFIHYAVKDEANNRYLILEGWTYAPGARKRDLQFELESILLTTTIE